ncbi:hypothetical protein V1358_01895 [Pseudoalteromonas sp. YIC-656]|uniref:hypothetical protein n=1 Tax=Pseudoalteromonas pernae TaxID=3118054 RepID=UPI003242D61F
MWLYVILAFVLVKTSFLGLGLVSVMVSLLALILLKLNIARPQPFVHMRAKRIYTSALWLHISVYVALVIKLFFIDSIEDVATFIAAHLVLHHLMAALIGATLLVLIIHSYFQFKALKH